MSKVEVCYFVRSCPKPSTNEYRDIADKMRCKWFSEYKGKTPVLSDSILDAVQFEHEEMAVQVAVNLHVRTGEEWEAVSSIDVHRENQRMKELLRKVLFEVEDDD